MALRLFSWSPVRTFGSAIGSVSACRLNSTDASPAPRRTENQPFRSKGLFRRRTQDRQKVIREQKIQGESRVLERFQTRQWKAGDVYSPHDLSPSEMSKWKGRSSPNKDAFDSLNINPAELYKNFSVMSEFITPMGRIKNRLLTGLRPVNQRRMARAIRRAMGLGLMPSVHRHPEILASELRTRADSLQ